MDWFIFLVIVIAGFFYIRHKILTSPLPKNPPEESDPFDIGDPTNSGMIGNMFYKRK